MIKVFSGVRRFCGYIVIEFLLVRWLDYKVKLSHGSGSWISDYIWYAIRYGVQLPPEDFLSYNFLELYDSAALNFIYWVMDVVMPMFPE